MFRVNVAVQLMLAVITTDPVVHVAALGPVHPAKVDPVLAEAVIVAV